MGFLWDGRFRKPLAAEAKAFTYSLNLDRKLARYDVRGSRAHVKMLGRRGIITRREAVRLDRALARIDRELSAGAFAFRADDEDIHTAVERRLVELAGAAGGKVHTARSRNDQIVLDEKLYVKDQLASLDEAARGLQKALVGVAGRVFPAVMPGYTHLQHSQPVLASHHLLAYVEMLQRDRERLADARRRTDVLPLGAGACCGTSLPIDRRLVARELGFAAVSRNSLDTVSDRDFLLEAASVCAIMLVHLSRLADDFILWSTAEFGFIELPEEFCTGSSMMPQKRNPDVLELVRGKTASAVGDLAALLVLVKGLPLSYNRDLQEDKRSAFAILETAGACLCVLARLLPGVRFNRERMAAAASSGFLLTTDLAEYLTAKGVAFRQAHRACGRLVRYCLDEGKEFAALSLAEFRRFSPRFDRDVYRLLNPQVSVASKKSLGGTAPALVGKELAQWKKTLS